MYTYGVYTPFHKYLKQQQYNKNTRDLGSSRYTPTTNHLIVGFLEYEHAMGKIFQTEIKRSPHLSLTLEIHNPNPNPNPNPNSKTLTLTLALTAAPKFNPNPDASTRTLIPNPYLASRFVTVT